MSTITDESEADCVLALLVLLLLLVLQCYKGPLVDFVWMELGSDLAHAVHDPQAE